MHLLVLLQERVFCAYTKNTSTSNQPANQPSRVHRFIQFKNYSQTYHAIA